MSFDDVLIPWGNVFFYRQPRVATLIRTTFQRNSAFAFIHRIPTFGNMLIGTAQLDVRQTGLDRVQGVRDKLAKLAAWRKGIHALLKPTIALGEKSPQSLGFQASHFFMQAACWQFQTCSR